MHFTYDGEREVIDGISFEMRRGQTVALVGPSGGGKSTLSELLPRFYDPSAGEILIDGISLRDYTQESVRAHMSVVAQDTVLFNDTIEGNIAMGKGRSFARGDRRSGPNRQCRLLHHRSARRLSDQYRRPRRETFGRPAAASLHRPRRIEKPRHPDSRRGDSALDTESEKLVQDALNKLLEGRTSVVIAHRLSTIHNADKIIVVDHGRIAEQGTHAELMARGGIYAKLIELSRSK